MATPAQIAQLAAQWNAADPRRRADITNYLRKASGKPPLNVVEYNKIIRDWAKEHFGALAAYLDVPQVGSIIMRAAEGGWTPDRLRVAVMQTKWWKTTSEAQRTFDALLATDPATATKRISDMESQIKTLLNQEGVAEQFSDTRVNELARTLIRNGAQADDVPKFVLAEVGYAPTQPVGKLGGRMTEVKSLADQFIVPLSDQTAFDWAKKIETGQATEDGLAEYLRGTAKGAWSFLADQIDKGFTTKQLLEPQIQLAAQDWEIDPDTLSTQDLLGLSTVEENGNVRMRDLRETRQYVRSTDRYWQTGGAEEEAAKFVTGLAASFGKA